MDRVKDALKWLGINQSDLLPRYDKVYAVMVDLAKKRHRPLGCTEIAHEAGYKARSVLDVLNELKRVGRVEKINGKWIPLR